MLQTFGVREQNSIKVKAFDSIMNLSLSLGQLLVILILLSLRSGIFNFGGISNVF